MVDYNKFAKTFSNSRKNMKWEEIDYFLEKIKFCGNNNILDIGCGNGRFLGALKNKFPEIKKQNYLGIDLSSGLLEEAKKIHSDFSENFLELNMLDIDRLSKLKKGSTGNVMEGEGLFDYIFFIASFHHLNNLEDREEVLSKAYNLLKKGGKIFMTNWALNSEINFDRYKKSIIPHPNPLFRGEGTKWKSIDYNIKIGGFDRYYHCFDLAELEYLAEKNNFKIIENRLFDNKRNFITILEK